MSEDARKLEEPTVDLSEIDGGLPPIPITRRKPTTAPKQQRQPETNSSLSYWEKKARNFLIFFGTGFFGFASGIGIALMILEGTLDINHPLIKEIMNMFRA